MVDQLAMDGQIGRQSTAYRQGLVLGFTMAEIVLLLVFCLLIAMAAFLRREEVKRHQAEELVRVERSRSEADRSLVKLIEKNPEIAKRLKQAAASPAAIDEFWRDLVDSRNVVDEMKKNGLTVAQLQEGIAEVAALKARGIDVKQALRDADIVGKIREVMPGAGDSANPPEAIAQVVQRGLNTVGDGGHQWPPMITLSEANGHYFKTGSAELSRDFRQELLDRIPDDILARIKRYNADVDVIEVVGHTDEQPLGQHQSNLDQSLVSVLKNGATISSVVPSDNAGLGLARAVSVVSVLLKSQKLAGFRILPLSGAQLVDTNETLALAGTPGDIRERRRIEIRLRKSDPRDKPAVKVAADPAPVRRPRPRPTPTPPPIPPSAQPLNILRDH